MKELLHRNRFAYLGAAIGSIPNFFLGKPENVIPIFLVSCIIMTVIDLAVRWSIERDN